MRRSELCERENPVSFIEITVSHFQKHTHKQVFLGYNSLRFRVFMIGLSLTLTPKHHGMSPSLEAYVRASLTPLHADMCHHVMSPLL